MLAAIKSPEDKEYISFKAARDQFDFILDDQIVQSEKAFGVKYDTRALKRRLRDSVQTSLSEHYRPKEENEPLPDQACFDRLRPGTSTVLRCAFDPAVGGFVNSRRPLTTT